MASGMSWRVAISTGYRLPVYTGACLAGLMAGVVSGSGRPTLVILLLALMVATAISSSRRALLWFVIIGGLIVVGVMQLYTPNVKYVRYVVPLAAFMLLLHGLIDRLRIPTDRVFETQSGVVIWSYVFLAISAVSLALNRDAELALIAFKSYFLIWVLFYAFVLYRWTSEELKFVPVAFLLVAFAQLPFVVHQFVFLVPLRIGIADDIVPVDIVAGTFGASLYGGGANAAMAAFMFVVVACVLGLWKRGVLSTVTTAAISLVLVAPMFFNEAKVTVLYVPLVALVIFYDDLLRRPLRLVLAGGAAFGILAALMATYTHFHPMGDLGNWRDLIRLTYEQQTSSASERNGLDEELTRWTSLTFWAKENLSGHPIYVAFGHGPGASRVQDQDQGYTVAETLAEKRYGGVRIGPTAVSALLWDTGVLGLISVLGLFFAAFRAAGKLMSFYSERDPFKAGLFDGLRAGIAVLALSLFHKDFFVFHLPYQTMVWLILGYIVVMQRNCIDEQRRHASP